MRVPNVVLAGALAGLFTDGAALAQRADAPALRLDAETAPASPGWYPVRGGSWDVSPDLVVQMRDAAKAQTSRPLDGYIIQYQGVLVHEQRTVRVMGSCALRGWSRALVFKHFPAVYDGGACYFDATYDPEQQRFVDFADHGKA